MELNNDCLRDVLLYIEKYQKPGHFLEFDDLCKSKELSKYNKLDIHYTLEQLKEDKLINADFYFGNNGLSDVSIGPLNPEGHRFLDNIRNHKIWKMVKNSVSKIGSVSLSMLISIAEKEVTKYLGL